MKQLVTINVETFKIGDRVEFYRDTNDRGMSMYSGTEYGIITKVNKVTAIVKTQTAAWKIELDRLHRYIDPFSGWDVAE
jgi:hypothetical protein